MKKRHFTARVAAVFVLTVALIATGAPLSADDHSDDRERRALARAIEGVWEPIVTIRDCQTEVALFSFLSMDSYIRGGSYIGESASEPNIRATGFGRWQHAGGRHFTASFQFFTYAADGTPIGRLRVAARIRLSSDGTAFRANDVTELFDLSGNLIGQVCGTREAKRLF